MNQTETMATVQAPPKITVKPVAFDAPWDWLQAGWRDLTANAGLSLTYGAIFTAISFVLLYGLAQVGWQALVIAMSGGFLILGPIFAVGLYEISRLNKAGETPTVGKIMGASLRAPGPLAFMGFFLLFLFSAWLRIAFLLFAIFFGAESLPPAEKFIPELLFTSHGLSMLIVGTAVGAGLALIAYAISVVSVPVLLQHKVDVFSAIWSSVETLTTNPAAMLLWAILIVAIMACGIAAGFVGLIVAFPLVGHATWHAYEALIEVEPGQ